MEISTEYDIEWHIQRQIETTFGALFADWMVRSAPALEKARRWLFIIVDGINENTNLPLFIKLLRNLLPKIEGKRIKLIISCRDIYWELFLPSLKGYLFRDAVALSEFSEQDWKRATELYFRQFKITADIHAQAAISLRNPLLLKFFCEAYQGQGLGSVTDVHLRSVFKLYIDRVSRSIAERKGLLDSSLVLDLLLRVVDTMWQNRLPAVEQRRIGLTPEETSSSDSIYNLIRSENVILDESRNVSTTSKIIRFVYDEFMEYVLARCWLDKSIGDQGNDSSIDNLLAQAMDAIAAFHPALGGIFYLDEMLSRNGQLVNRAISSPGPVREVLLHSRQTSLLHALERINADEVDEELLGLVSDFETAVGDDLRPRLSAVLTTLIERNPGMPSLRPLIARMLDVASVPASSEVERQGGQDLLLLPPARYHYSDETKLSAIALIIGSRSEEDYDLAQEGIRRLGRMDLHAALYALKSVDLAAEDVVYKNIEDHIDAALPEYRIYCAWLLRERYGPQPSRFLLHLLSANETRVHSYTFSLFETRRIETEFLDGIMDEMHADMAMKPWLLTYRIKLLARRTAFLPHALSNTHGQKIVEVLKSVSKHSMANVRLAAFRGLGAYPEFIDRPTIAEWVRTDPDAHVRALAGRTGS
jgi:hypothetical protein